MRRFFLFICVALLFASCREMVEKEADEKLAQAEAALLSQDWSEANESFHEAIMLDPERADAWIGRGLTLTHLGETGEARLHYEEALSLCRKNQAADPMALDPVRRQIMLLVLLNRSDEALELAQITAETHPNREGSAELPKLVKRLTDEFDEMILPPDDRTDRTIPYPKELP